jgi:integrase
MGMRALSANHHLVERNGSFYFRRRVPLHLVPRIGKPFVQYSLGTNDKKEAIKRREVEDLKWSARFEDLASDPGASKSEPDSLPPSNARPPSDESALRLVYDYVQRMDERSRKRHLEDGPATEEERRETRMNVEVDMQHMRSLDDPDAQASIQHIGRKILRSAELPSDDPSALSTPFLDLVRRAVLELQRRTLARLDDNYGSPYFDELFNPAKQPSLNVRELAEQLLADKREEAELNGLAPKSIDKQRSSLALVVEILGEETPVSAIGYDQCKNVQKSLAKLPPNRNKTFKDLTIAQTIERARVEGIPPMSPLTQQPYLAALKDLLDLALNKGFIAHNHAQSLKPLKRDGVAAGDKRAPFTLQQIKTFFESDFYQNCARGGPKPYKLAVRDWQFWMPLLCLFMGLRPNEVCQLHKGDVRATAAGVHYVDVVVSAEDSDPATQSLKTLKTATSRRRVPIHPELLAIGFLDFVAGKAGAEALLFSVKPDKYGNHARYALKRFADAYLSAAIELKPDQAFYSFRHAFRDALRRSKAPPEILRAFGGWSEGKVVSDDYGDKYDPDLTVDHMKMVGFPGLDLSHIYMKAQ